MAFWVPNQMGEGLPPHSFQILLCIPEARGKEKEEKNPKINTAIMMITVGVTIYPADTRNCAKSFIFLLHLVLTGNLYPNIILPNLKVNILRK